MKDRLMARISNEGPMYFDAFMDACLYDPDAGFFASGDVRTGTRGDFLTSPQVSPWFGSLVGGWAADRSPSNDAILVEIGFGSGALLDELAPFWLDNGLDVYAVEVSEAARNAVEARSGAITVVAAIDHVPAGVDAVVVANEVLDNLPVALAKRSKEGWLEIAVDVRGDDLVLVDVEARPAVQDWCENTFGPVALGTVATAQLAAARFIEDLVERFRSTSVCLIDYGANATELASRDLDSIVRTYRSHRSGHDWLAGPGATDITVDVNTTAIERVAERIGANIETMTQREFLIAQGADELIADARDMERQYARSGDIMNQLASRADRVNLEALLDVDGLGGFRVLLIESGNPMSHG